MKKKKILHSNSKNELIQNHRNDLIQTYQDQLIRLEKKGLKGSQEYLCYQNFLATITSNDESKNNLAKSQERISSNIFMETQENSQATKASSSSSDTAFQNTQHLKNREDNVAITLPRSNMPSIIHHTTYSSHKELYESIKCRLSAYESIKSMTKREIELLSHNQSVSHDRTKHAVKIAILQDKLKLIEGHIALKSKLLPKPEYELNVKGPIATSQHIFQEGNLESRLIARYILKGKNIEIENILKEYEPLYKDIGLLFARGNLLIFSIEERNEAATILLLKYAKKKNYTKQLLDQFYKGKYPIIHAIEKGNIIIIQAILAELKAIDNDFNINKEDANEDENNCTLLHLACKTGNTAIVKFLVEQGADINARDIHGKSPFYYLNLESSDNRDTTSPTSMKNEQEKVARKLTASSSKNGLKSSQEDNGLAQLVETLLKLSKPIDDEIWAHIIKNADSETIKLIFKFEKENNKHSKGSKKRSFQESSNIQEFDTPDKPNEIPINKVFDNNDSTALHILCKNPNAKTSAIKSLIDAGANINLQNKDSQTPLHIAIINKSLKAVELLLQKGAETTIRDNNNKVAFEYISEETSGVENILTQLSLAKDTLLEETDLNQGLDNLKSFLKSIRSDALEPSYDLGLRPHQKACLQAISHMSEETRELAYPNHMGYVKMATGTGKTRIFMSLLKIMGLKTSIIVPTKILAEQTRNKLKEFDPDIDVGLINGEDQETGHQVTIIIYDTLDSHYQGLKLTDLLYSQLIILDEVHASLTKLRKNAIQFFLDKHDRFVVGFTATDEFNTSRKIDDSSKVNELLHHRFFEYTINQGLEDGILPAVDFQPFDIPENINQAITKITKGSAKSKQTDVASILKINMSKVIDLLVNIAKKSPSILIYVPTIELADLLAIELNKIIDNQARSIHSKTASDPSIILADHAANKFKFLINVDVLTAGYDDENLISIVDLYPTTSIISIAQRVGRIFRTPTKEDFLQHQKTYYQLKLKNIAHQEAKTVLEEESITIRDNDIADYQGYTESIDSEDDNNISREKYFKTHHLMQAWKDPSGNIFPHTASSSSSWVLTYAMKQEDGRLVEYYDARTEETVSKLTLQQTSISKKTSALLCIIASDDPNNLQAYEDFSNNIMAASEIIFNDISYGIKYLIEDKKDRAKTDYKAEFNQNYNIIYTEKTLLKASNFIVDSLKLAHEPTIKQFQEATRDIIHLQSMLQETNFYSLSLTIIDVTSQFYYGDYKQGLTQLGTVIGLTILPTILGPLAPAYTEVMNEYVKYQVFDKIYNFAMDYNSPEFQLKSNLAYGELYNNLGLEDKAKECFINSMHIVQENLKSYGSESEIQHIAEERNLVGMLEHFAINWDIPE